MFTVNVDGTVRSSSASRTSRVRCGVLRIGRVTGRANTLRIQERIDMGTSGSWKEQEGKPSTPRADGVQGQGRHAGPQARTVGATSPRHSVGTTKKLSGNYSLSLHQPCA